MDKPVTLILGLGLYTGEAVARRFVDAGHAVVACDPQPKRVEKVADNLRDRAIVQQEELHTRIGLKNCLATAIEAYGHVDHLVCIPPSMEKGPLNELEIDAFDKVQMKAIRGSVLTLQLFDKLVARRLEEEGETSGRRAQAGSVTFILSLAASQMNAGEFGDAVVQHAILGVMRAGAIELAPRGIRANAICALRPRAESEEGSALKKRTPMGRAAQPDEIADAALYLSLPTSAIVTGETLVMDGGRGRLSGVVDS